MNYKQKFLWLLSVCFSGLLVNSALAAEPLVKSPDDVAKVLSYLLRWTYTIFFVVAIFFLLLAAFNFVFARGDPEKIKSARSQILWALVAIAIALVSVGANQIIESFIKGALNP